MYVHNIVQQSLLFTEMGWKMAHYFELYTYMIYSVNLFELIYYLSLHVPWMLIYFLMYYVQDWCYMCILLILLCSLRICCIPMTRTQEFWSWQISDLPRKSREHCKLLVTHHIMLVWQLDRPHFIIIIWCCLFLFHSTWSAWPWVIRLVMWSVVHRSNSIHIVSIMTYI